MNSVLRPVLREERHVCEQEEIPIQGNLQQNGDDGVHRLLSLVRHRMEEELGGAWDIFREHYDNIKKFKEMRKKGALDVEDDPKLDISESTFKEARKHIRRYIRNNLRPEPTEKG